MNEETSDTQKLLRAALRGNALFSIMSSGVIFGMNRTFVQFLGLPGDTDLTSLAIGLLVFAGWLLWNARRQKIRLVDAWIGVALDMVWVVGSYVLLFAVEFTTGGKWAVGLVAELVFLFGVLQWLGLRRIRRSRHAV
jgi:hypothetical protein